MRRRVGGSRRRNEGLEGESDAMKGWRGKVMKGWRGKVRSPCRPEMAPVTDTKQTLFNDPSVPSRYEEISNPPPPPFTRV